MDRQAQLEAMMRQYMASQQNRGAVSDAEMQMMAPQQGMGQMTDADMAIQQNQQFNQDAQQQQADMFYQNQMQQYGAERPMAPPPYIPEVPSDEEWAAARINPQSEQYLQQYQASKAPQLSVPGMLRGPGPLTDAERDIGQNQQFNQYLQQYQADQFRGSQQISPEQYMGLLQMLGGGR